MWIKRGILQDARITINVPFVYMARDVMILMRAISITRALLRGCPWIRDFFGPWWQQVKRVPFGPKKVEISGPNPSNGLRNTFSCIKIIKSKRHPKNRNIGNFKSMSFRATPSAKSSFTSLHLRSPVHIVPPLYSERTWVLIQLYTCSNDFYLPSRRLEDGGGVESAPCVGGGDEVQTSRDTQTNPCSLIKV